MKITDITSTQKAEQNNRLAAYCRVSSDSEDQLHSFAAQVCYYSNYEKQHPEFKLVGVYADEGLSGTSITVYGSLAQSESENISANVRWGKEQCAKEGNVPFRYQNTLGYRKGTDGNPEIVPDEAEIIRYIYQRFLAGDSYGVIKTALEEKGVSSPSGKGIWSYSTIRSILTNEKYKGDMIVNKTFVVDCISKRIKKNNGERTKYYIENNHPAIIDDITFGKVQQELARRNSKHKVKQIGTKTELGKYSSKYALTELLVCGECGSPYRRCTWTASGNKRIVWRCINRLDYGKKYCHDSPTIEESTLHKAITEAIKTIAMQNTHLLQTLKTHIAMNMEREEKEDRSIDIKVRIAEIDNKFKSLLSSLSVDLENNSQTEQAIAELMTEKRTLEKELEKYKTCGASTSHESKLNEVCHITELIENQPLQFDDNLIRQMLECVVVLSKEQIKIVFKDGTEIDQSLT